MPPQRNQKDKRSKIKNPQYTLKKSAGSLFKKNENISLVLSKFHEKYKMMI